MDHNKKSIKSELVIYDIKDFVPILQTRIAESEQLTGATPVFLALIFNIN